MLVLVTAAKVPDMNQVIGLGSFVPDAEAPSFVDSRDFPQVFELRNRRMRSPPRGA